MREVSPSRLIEIVGTSLPPGPYLHWHKLRYHPPPEGLSIREWWLATKWQRMSVRSYIPLVDDAGKQFSFCLPDSVLRKLHLVDSKSGVLTTAEEIVNRDTKDRYLVTSLMEEAITSSQLEGASTTRTVAKEMIRSGRKPRDTSERMILQNFKTMDLISGRKHSDITAGGILEILESLEPESRIRTNQDNVRVEDRANSTVLHIPPDASCIDNSLKDLCAFANCTANTRPFVHPVIRAIIAHFWIGFLHPFIDGNGRTARALFYWSMLHHGYWLTEFLSISRHIVKAPARYARAYLYTETDDGDLTYFIDYHLGILLRALDDLGRYLREKSQELSQTRALLRNTMRFNHRQLALLSHALKNPDAAFSIRSHLTSHRVVYETARKDLMELEEQGLLQRETIQRKMWFFPPHNLGARIKRLR